jgi:type II secretion system protein N
MKKWIAFTGYIIFVTLVFLYYLFPTEAMTAYVNYRLADFLPEFHLTVGQMRPSFPPGLKLNSAQLYRKNSELIKADQFTIRPQYLTLFSRTKSFVLNGSLNDGSISGTAEVARGKSLLNIDLSVAQVEISSIPVVKEMMPHSLSGVINGNLVFNNQPPNGIGKADFILSNCMVDFKPAFFGMNQLKMDSITAKGELADRVLKIETVEVKGRELNGKATGTMTLRNPIMQSAINISGQVTPTPVLMKNLSDILPIDGFAQDKEASAGIPFKISGTIESPNFSLK